MNELPRLTAKEIHDFQICSRYTLRQIEDMLGKRKSVNAFDVLRHEDVASEDKLWIVTRYLIPANIHIAFYSNLNKYFNSNSNVSWFEWGVSDLLKLLKEDYE